MGQAADEGLQVSEQLAELLVALIDRAEDGVELVDDVADELIVDWPAWSALPTWLSNVSTVPPSPCSTWMSSYDSWLTSSGFRAVQQRLGNR